MLKTSVALIAAALTVCACSGSSSVLGPSAANVAVQRGDLPSGMVKCDLTRDLEDDGDEVAGRQEQGRDGRLHRGLHRQLRALLWNQEHRLRHRRRDL